MRTAEGFVYVYKIRDVVSGVVLAHTTRSHMRAELVTETIRKAMNRCAVPTGCVFHSDRGSQYTAKTMAELVRNLGWKQRFSRVGKPGDNAWSESIFSILKKEAVHWRHFRTREEASQAIFDCIEGFNNT